MKDSEVSPTEPNWLLRAARERVESPDYPGRSLSRVELAEAVCALIWERTGSERALDAHYIAKLERGVVRWPTADYRRGFRDVLHVATDRELGFKNPSSEKQPELPDVPSEPAKDAV
ncbi:hypothetical protein [Kribbella yunnanensis]|uniref:hypothetical protein n=1 Tax=Kribbella yunnanensis TaxID=190194 RepID=UPI0031DE8557